MADIADIAEESMQQINTEEISKMFLKESEKYCIECGEDIPEKRRSLGGVTLCIDCKSLQEK